MSSSTTGTGTTAAPSWRTASTTATSRPRNNDRVKFYLMWANHDVDIWDKRLPAHWTRTSSGRRRSTAPSSSGSPTADRKYFKHPSYYTIDGKPVFMIYDLQNLINGLGGVEATADAFAWFRGGPSRPACRGCTSSSACRRLTQNLSGVDGGARRRQAEIIEQLGFDSITHYQYVHFTNIDRDYDRDHGRRDGRVGQLDGELPIPYFPHVSSGGTTIRASRTSGPASSGTTRRRTWRRPSARPGTTSMRTRGSRR